MLPEAVTQKIVWFIERRLSGTISVNFKGGKVLSLEAREHVTMIGEDRRTNHLEPVCKSCTKQIQYGMESYLILYGQEIYCVRCMAQKIIS